MTFYDIDTRVLEVLEKVDPETGELLPEAEEELALLDIEREQKIENVACYIKETKMFLNALKDEKKRIAEKMANEEKKLDRLESLLTKVLDGEKFKTEKVSVSFRKSEIVDVDDNFVEYAKSKYLDELLTFYEPSPNRLAIKAYIKGGNALDCARLVQNTSMIIK